MEIHKKSFVIKHSREPWRWFENEVAYRQVLENDLLPLISHVEPRNVDEALIDDSWIQSMHEELH